MRYTDFMKDLLKEAWGRGVALEVAESWSDEEVHPLFDEGISVSDALDRLLAKNNG